MEGWTVKVKLGRGHATCTARRGDRKVTLTYFFKNKRFVVQRTAKTLADVRAEPLSELDEIKDACLVAIAVERLTA